MLANRLTENPDWKVLLIEAGKVEGILNQVPLMTAAVKFTEYNWKYYSEPQKNACFGWYPGNSIEYPVKVLLYFRYGQSFLYF